VRHLLQLALMPFQQLLCLCASACIRRATSSATVAVCSCKAASLLVCQARLAVSRVWQLLEVQWML
jgi:hypothetical protein